MCCKTLYSLSGYGTYIIDSHNKEVPVSVGTLKRTNVQI